VLEDIKREGEEVLIPSVFRSRGGP